MNRQVSSKNASGSWTKTTVRLLLIPLLGITGCFAGQLNELAFVDPSVVEGVSVTAVKWGTKDDADFIELKIENYANSVLVVGKKEVLWTDEVGNEKLAVAGKELEEQGATREPVAIPPGRSAVVCVAVPFREPGALLLDLGPSMQWIDVGNVNRPFGTTFVIPLDRPESIRNSAWEKLTRGFHFAVNVNSDDVL